MLDLAELILATVYCDLFMFYATKCIIFRVFSKNLTLKIDYFRLL